MEWRGRRGSRNIEDRRRMGGGRMGGAAPIGGVGLLAVLAIGWFLGIDVTPLLDGTMSQTPGAPRELTAAEREQGQFVSVVLADTEAVWTDVFADQLGGRYQPPVMVLYAGVTASPCGSASGATGPFYCPPDRKIYLDTEFFATLSRQLGAHGDFAAAYVVAHEVAHHVQNELGILGEANAARARMGQAESNAVSVRVELQADCLAGVWARQVQDQFGVLEAGDVEEAVNAAHRIGDDMLQRNAGRTPMPHTYTHGTAAQRARWFMLGQKSGDINSCDTFSAQRL